MSNATKWHFVRELLERMKDVVLRRQYWLLVMQNNGRHFNMFCNCSPIVKIVELYGSNVIVVDAIRVDGKSYRQAQRTLDRKKADEARAIQERRAERVGTA